MKSTTDYGLISWIEEVRGITPDSKEIVRRGKMKAYFNLDDDAWFKLKEDYDKSEYFRFHQRIERNRNLTY